MAAVALPAATLTLACRCFEAAGEGFAARAPGFYLNSLGKSAGNPWSLSSHPMAKGPASLLHFRHCKKRKVIKVDDRAEGSCLHFLEALSNPGAPGAVCPRVGIASSLPRLLCPALGQHEGWQKPASPWPGSRPRRLAGRKSTRWDWV